jgi:succinate dehydrogenase / fumarate reductase cytochrome b subunit
MRAQRPVYLNLLKIRQPLPAVVSIFHRISGALLFLFLPLALYWFEQSLRSEEAFLALDGNGLVRLCLFAVLGLYAYHFFAGLRFLLFDLHRPGMYRHIQSSARAVLMAALLAVLSLGAWLW